jgi:hypothetical protein
MKKTLKIKARKLIITRKNPKYLKINKKIKFTKSKRNETVPKIIKGFYPSNSS